jgi:hypothetical protein
VSVRDRGAIARRIEELLERRLLGPLTDTEEGELRTLYDQENTSLADMQSS